MPNIQSLLKSEISRITRKEIRAETDSLKKSSSQYRSQIVALKRQMAALERLLHKLSKGAKAAPADKGVQARASDGLRFRAEGFGAHRKRLGLSAAQAGALLGVSAISVYHWESGKSKPRSSHMPRIAAFRNLSKKQAAAAVEQVMG